MIAKMSIPRAIPMPLLKTVRRVLTILHIDPFVEVVPDFGVVVASLAHKTVRHTLTILYLDPFLEVVPDFGAVVAPLAPRCLAKPIAERHLQEMLRDVDQNDFVFRSGIGQ